MLTKRKQDIREQVQIVTMDALVSNDHILRHWSMKRLILILYTIWSKINTVQTTEDPAWIRSS
ncbi:MAG: hypothetical protein PWP56_486 [Acetobacterium sp.]|nr:hypothetical protein [Acetobacterium sp.]